MDCCEKCWKFIVLFLSLSVDTYDFISDWIFYSELELAENGLVFGVYEKEVVRATLVFCIVGSFTFLLEIVMNIWEFKSDNTKTGYVVAIVTLVTLAVEDVPHISINLHIALCREEATNTIQVVKASTAMLEVLVKLILMIARYCKSTCKGEHQGKLRRVLNILTGVLILTILVLSGIVFYFTRNVLTKIDFDIESRRYLQGVSIFARFDSPSSQLPQMDKIQWIKLTGIQNVMRSENIPLVIMYTAVPSRYLLVRRNDDPLGKSVSCFKMDSTLMTLVPSKDCFDVFNLNKNAAVVSLRLDYVKPSKHQPLGDINYNWRIYQHKCKSIAASHSAVTLSYFKVETDVMETLALIPKNRTTDQYRYYTAPGDLINAREYWKTGRNRCLSTGREAPKLDTNIRVACFD